MENRWCLQNSKLCWHRAGSGTRSRPNQPTREKNVVTDVSRTSGRLCTYRNGVVARSKRPDSVANSLITQAPNFFPRGSARATVGACLLALTSSAPPKATFRSPPTTHWLQPACLPGCLTRYSLQIYGDDSFTITNELMFVLTLSSMTTICHGIRSGHGSCGPTLEHWAR